MKKRLYINSTLLVLFIVIFVLFASISYSYFQTSVLSPSNLGSTSITLSLDYEGDEDINEIIPLGTSKEDGVLRTNKAKLGEGSTAASLTLYLDLYTFPEEFASSGVIYEVWVDDEEVARSTGTFEGASAGDRITLLEGLKLTDTYQTLKIYIWINGNLVGNELKDKAFSGKIVASAGNITGAISE